MRKIIHLDMDCFYAAIEMRDYPVLRGQPVAVGGSSRRGVLTTCSYEARKFGCRSAMPTYKAIELCPKLIVVPARFDVYRQEAERLRTLMREYTDLVEPLSLDEAFLDVTASPFYAWNIAKELRRRIYAETGLTASAGIAPNKLLAKIASDWRKPNGQFAIRPHEIEDFMRPLAVEKLWGIGPKTAKKLDLLGIRNCAELQNESLERLDQLFGKFGRTLYNQARGIDERAVESSRLRKSLSTERTYDESLQNETECQEAIRRLYQELESDLHKKTPHPPIRKFFVRLKFDDFQKTTRECVAGELSLSVFQKLLLEALPRRHMRAIRLMGVGVRFGEEKPRPSQLELFDPSP